MKELKTDIIIFSGLLILALIIGLITQQSTIDIQLHDTYFVIDKFSLTILIVGSLTFVIFLSRALTRKFRTIGSNVGLIIGLVFIALTTYGIIQLQQSYLTSMMRPDDEGLPDRGQFIMDSKRRITWSWALLGVWLVALIALTFRTINIWKPSKQRP